MNFEGKKIKEDKDIKLPFEMSEEKPFLMMTIRDHEKMKSGLGESDLDKRITANPDKTIGELMTDEELKNYLEKERMGLDFLHQRILKHEATLTEEDQFLKLNAEFEKTLDYLQEIGRG